MSSEFLLYGANGYVGSEVARLAVQQGLRPILAGRSAQAVSTQAKLLGLEYRSWILPIRRPSRAPFGRLPPY